MTDGSGETRETCDETQEGPVGTRARRRRLVACGLGVALVVACGLGAAAWAMRPATQPADEGPVAEEAAPQDASVPELLSGLSYHGRDVSVPSGAVTVTAAGGHVMVEERSDADAAARVDLSARRSAALAHALDGQTVGGEEVSDVTWVACDPDGAVKAAVKNATTSESAGRAEAGKGGDGAAVPADDATNRNDGSAAAPSEPATAGDGRDESGDGTPAGASGAEDPGSDASGDAGTADREPTTSEVVSGSTGWTMSDDTKDGLSDAAPDLPASGGEAPTTPDGAEIVPEQPAPAEPSEEVPAEGDGGGEPGSGDSGQASQPASGGGSGSSGSSAVAGGGSQSSGSSSSGASSTPAHQHDWQAVYGSRWVQDSAAWDETVVVSAAWDEPVYETKSVIGCTWDGQTFGSGDAFDSHNDSVHDGEASYTIVKQRVQTGTTHHDAVTKVVHHDATGHNESYVTGYRCSSCGSTK